MVRKLILAIAVIIQLLYSVAYAQSLADINTPKIVPPSPDAAALGKYGQVPVDKSSGIPSISIPLYEIKTSRFSLPISLSYHASGIKVSEYSSWVGAGWTLNAGGVITRTIIGLADEEGGFLSSKGKSVSSLLNTLNQITNTVGAVSTASVPPPAFDQVLQHQTDYQPDNFFYNFANNSGSFVFGADSLRTPVLTSYKPLKITYAPTLDTLTILDESGNIYIFADKEPVNGYKSSWYLSKMISADHSDVITFTYQTDKLGGFEETFPNFTQTYTTTAPALYGNPPNYGGCPITNPHPYSVSPAPYNEISYNRPLYISTITFNGGKVDFKVKTGRLESTNNYGGPDLSLDSVIISNYDYNQNEYTRLKSFKINTGYWTNNMPIYPSGTLYSGSIYRLKLDSVVENDQNNVAVKTHKFGYDATLLPPVNYYAQDHWGYYNGKDQNISLLQQQQGWDYAGNVYTVGDADRSINAAAMKAGMLERITYPTKGYTVFSYEPHQFLKYSNGTLPQRMAHSSSSGYWHQADSSVFTTDTKPGGGVYIGIMTVTMNTTNSSSTPIVRLKQVSNGMVLYLSPTNPSASVSYPVALQSGQQYQLYTSSPGGGLNMTEPTAGLTINYDVNASDSANVVAYGGGLRINSIKNYNPDGSIISTESYKYGTTENGTGVLMNGNLALVDTLSRVNWFGATLHTGVGDVYQACWNVTKIYSSNLTYSLSTLSGSPVAYGAVTVYHGDTVNNIGKSRYEYANYPDSVLQVGGSYYNGVMLDPVSWKNGQVMREANYRNIGGGSYALVQEKNNTFLNVARTPAAGIYVGYMFEATGALTNPRWPAPGICGYPATGIQYDSFPNVKMYDYFSYPISNGSAVPNQTITTNYANDGTTVLTQDTIKYFYDNHVHMYPTRIRSYNGKGDSLLKAVKYPQDMVAANLDPTGIYAAMVSANIISPVIQFTDLKNATQMEQSVTNYASTNGIINPSTVSLQIMANTAETRLNYQKYDSTNGNLLTVSKQGGPPVSYIWGYNGEYPVAEVKNALAKNIFYESFEDGNGNSAGTDAKSGYYSRTGGYSKTLGSTTALDNGSYVLSYWQKSGAAWTFVATPVTVSTGTYTISLSGQVDDIRFYPANALMTTYTYNPTVGVTSVTDAKNQVTYYEYDSFLRLLNIKDKDGNIVKSFCYNYAGQTTGCSVDPLLPPPPPTYPFTLTNSTGVSGFVAAFSGGVGNFNFPASGSTTVNIPAGSYTVTINPINAPTNRKFLLGGRSPVTAPGTTFTSVVVGPTGTETPLIIQNP